MIPRLRGASAGVECLDDAIFEVLTALRGVGAQRTFTGIA